MRAPPKKTTPAIMHPSRIGPRLTALREALGLKPSQIADAIGCDRGLWAKFEKGQRPITDGYALMLADRYDVTMDFIYRGRLDAIPDPLRGLILARITAAAT